MLMSEGSLPPGLWVVGLPIGNVADLTLRACAALWVADWVLCEDTRKTAALLSRVFHSQGPWIHVLETQGIQKTHWRPKRLQRLDAHATVQQQEGWIRALQRGDNLALVTDAGTPGIQDPGASLVAAVRRAGLRVTPVPGVSAVTCWLSVSGFLKESFLFRGFFPRSPHEQKKELAWVRQWAGRVPVVIWFETAVRLLDTLTLLSTGLEDGDWYEVEMFLGKEMTKVYQQFFSGSLARVKEYIHHEAEQKRLVGEWTLGVQIQPKKKQALLPTDDPLEWEGLLKDLKQAGHSSLSAIKEVAQLYELPKRVVYQAWLSLEKS